MYFSGGVNLFAGLASIVSEGKGKLQGKQQELLRIWARCGTNRSGQQSGDIRKVLGEKNRIVFQIPLPLHFYT